MSTATCVLSHRRPVAATDGYLCGHHMAEVRAHLSEVVELWELHRTFLLPGSTEPDGHKHTKGSEAPAPLRLDVAALGDNRGPDSVPLSYLSNWDESKNRLVSNGGDVPAVREQLRAWVEYVETDRGVTINESTSAALSLIVAALNRHLEWLVADDHVRDFTRELAAARKALMHAAGLADPEPLGECYIDLNPVVGAEVEECGGPIWPTNAGASCGNCNHTWCGIELIKLRLILDHQDRAKRVTHPHEVAGAGRIYWDEVAIRGQFAS